MKRVSIVLASALLISCSEADFEEYVFRKTLQHNLTELCGKDDSACIHAVESQIQDCMEKSGWRKFMNNQDDPVEHKRFTTEFYACIVDSHGKPIFVTKD